MSQKMMTWQVPTGPPMRSSADVAFPKNPGLYGADDVADCTDVMTWQPIRPACNLPLKAVRGGGKMVIVNLQATPKDKKAALVIHARVDEVIAGIMKILDLSIPPFVRVDRVLITSYFTSKSRNRTRNWTLRVSSSHGQKAPLPFVDSVEVSFPDRPDLKSAVLKDQPFILRRTTRQSKDFDALVKLHFGDGCMCTSVDIRHHLEFGEKSKCLLSRGNKDDLDLIKDQAVKDGMVGHVLQAETRIEDEGTEYAIVTGILRYDDAVVKPTHVNSTKASDDLDEHIGENTSKRFKLSTPEG
ncbi:hypothetical protein L7F22_031295 [Adiantum nelumboides]|nr:hypothetical protein [Adiantum nelumboides]